MSIMPNNLHKMILQSGISKREVAALKGVTPETLSRHISGKIGISLDDAERYGKILGCTAQEVFFPSDPITVIATNVLQSADEKVAKEKAEFKWTRKLVDDGRQYFPVTQSVDPKKVGAWQTLIDKKYSGRFQFLQNVIEFVLLDPILNEYVSPQQCAGRLCYAQLDDTHKCTVETTNIIHALVYPNPDGTYTLVNVFGLGAMENKRLKWATPVLGANMMPTQSVDDVLSSTHGRLNNLT